MPIPEQKSVLTKTWLIAGLILAATAAAYLPALTAEFTNWDDKGYVTHNEALQEGDLARLLSEPCAGNFHPLTMFTLWLNHVLMGPSPFSFHLLNVLLHLACTLLTFQLCWRLGRERITIAATGAILFGLHPVHVESVAWVSERKDVLFALFFLWGMLTYARYLTQGKLAHLLVTLLLFMLSLLSKPSAVTFPLVLLLMDALGKRRWSWKMLLEKVPFFLLALAMGLLTLHFQADAGRIADFESRGPFERIAMSGYGFALYLGKTVLPIGLAAVHPNPPDGMPLGWAYFLAPALLVLWVVGALLLRKRARLVAFGMLLFLVAMLPTMQFISFGEAIIAERYLYVPLLGAGLILGWAADRWLAPRRWLLAGALVALGTALGVGSFLRCQVWDNSMTLWNDTIAQYPGNCFTALICRADLHRENQHPGLALVDAEEAIRQRPHHYFGYFARGNAYFDLKEPEKALADYSQSISLYPRDAATLSNRAVVYHNMGQFERAIADLDMAIGLKPRRGDYYYRRSQAYFYLGNLPAAKYDLQQAQALGIQPAKEYIDLLDKPI